MQPCHEPACKGQAQKNEDSRSKSKTMSKPKYFVVEQHDEILVFAAISAVGTLVEDEAREEWDVVLEMIDDYDAKSAVIDLTNIDYFGSIMLYLMVRLWKWVSAKGGQLALCNVSKIGREILETAKFDSMWPIVETREEAIAAVKE